MAAAVQERAELLDLLEDLSADEWSVQSLCTAWTVRDVVAHLLSYEGVAMADLLKRMIRGRAQFDRINALSARDLQRLEPVELIDRLRAFPKPTGLTAARGGAVGLVDCLLHQQDIRRPLGRPRAIDPERLRYALGFAVTAPPLRGFWHVRGTRVVATDVDWAHGRGPEARGLAEAVLMTLAGRSGPARELDGPGAATLRRRLG
ncbi:maleylpyruvate isomerase family mycothiol-dependent enzyme [Brevibacterium senegalense]|uniref:maleylpyruvate isomerase family mycothiol-dependent enzyme n=1 Tax=Brevibacterium senegalense TaxID=1033736 RepID=UPI0011C8D18F